MKVYQSKSNPQFIDNNQPLNLKNENYQNVKISDKWNDPYEYLVMQNNIYMYYKH